MKKRGQGIGVGSAEPSRCRLRSKNEPNARAGKNLTQQHEERERSQRVTRNASGKTLARDEILVSVSLFKENRRRKGVALPAIRCSGEKRTGCFARNLHSDAMEKTTSGASKSGTVLAKPRARGEGGDADRLKEGKKPELFQRGRRPKTVQENRFF